MTKRRQYSDEFRASTVVMLQAAGYPDTPGALTRVAEHVKVPAMTISRWFKATNNPPPNEIVKQSKKELHEILRDLAHQIAAVIPEKLDEANLQHTSVSLGIVIEKMQLLEGKATERVEHTLDEQERVSRITELLERGRNRGVGQAAHSDTLQ